MASPASSDNKRINRILLARFQNELKSGEGSEVARSYLLKERKITEEIIEAFNIGWCPPSMRISGKENLAGRIIFPITDSVGDIIAFCGRKPFAKANGPWWHESYPKGQFLYGLFENWKYILEYDCAIIVEGTIDVFSLYKNGFRNVVANLGSTLTEEQFAKLRRFTDNFIFLYDADPAGRSGAKIAAGIVNDNKDYCEFVDVSLKIGDSEYDPDEFINQYGSEKLAYVLIKKAESKIKFSKFVKAMKIIHGIELETLNAGRTM